ncbi:MAG: acyl-CoA thioesterase [Nevskiales bacterium]
MSDAPSRAQFRHFTSLPVQWGDMDMLGHVNNVIFFRYAESGRIAYFDQMLGNDPDIWGGEGPILAEIQCRFIQQMRYPAQLEIGTRTVKIGSRSLAIECGIFKQGEEAPVATSRAAVVWFNYREQKAALVPDTLRATIRGFEAVNPEE